MKKWIFALGTLVCLPGALPGQVDRIATKVDPGSVREVAGNVKPQARPELDEGPVDPGMKLNWVRLTIKPSASQQASLDQLLRDQQNPRSASYRKWLTPEQFADRFGASQGDFDKIAGWLRSQGLDIVSMARGRRFIAFNATAGQIQSVLKTEIHHYRVDGKLHFANSTAPAVPEAIEPLVEGFLGLDDFEPKRASRAKPHYTGSGGGHDVTPGDLAIIYDVVPIYQAGFTGSGVTIAVMGQSQIQTSDITRFQSIFGVPNNLPKTILVPGATDPGLVMGDEGESDLDLEYAGGMAPDAQVLFVYASGVVKSLMYTIDQQLAPVISYSYAACEPNASSAEAASFESLGQQANAEGITWVVSSGDDGAAMCDTTLATHGLAVSIEAALPEATGVGGTMFANNSTNFWSTSNSSDDASALSYIPETAWDESTDMQLSASGGGYSIFYPRPAWQTGAGTTGPKRGVPDVSFTAAPNDDPYATIEVGQPEQIGGTSAAAPVFAGLLAILNEFLGTNGLGNINPNLYYMATATPSSFHDVTTGGNIVPCGLGTPDCTQQGNFGYVAGPGWDAATGWGSVDATALFNNWSVAAGPPKIGAVVNGASLTNTGLSPGLIFTIFGSALGPANGQTLELDDNGDVSTLLSAIGVSVDGTAAPLLYVGPGQINAVAPYELISSLGRTVSVQVFDGVNQSSNLFGVQVVATAPAMFSLGNNQGAILNQDGSVNGAGNPAARGTYIQVYGTGEGQTNPPGVDGQIADETVDFLPRPVAPVTMTIGGVSATPSYAGTAPQSFAGFFQVNVQIPNNVKVGNQPVILKIGNASSPPLNVAVK